MFSNWSGHGHLVRWGKSNLDLSVGGIVCQHIISEVLGRLCNVSRVLMQGSGDIYHWGDPFTCVDTSVQNNSGLATLSTSSPEVNTGDNSTLNGSSAGDDLRTGRVGGNQISQEREMVRVCMVRVEVSEICS